MCTMHKIIVKDLYKDSVHNRMPQSNDVSDNLNVVSMMTRHPGRPTTATSKY